MCVFVQGDNQFITQISFFFNKNNVFSLFELAEPISRYSFKHIPSIYRVSVSRRKGA